MALHSALTGADLHESKGVASAVQNTVYVSNGSGSGSWSAQRFVTHITFPDVSTAGSIYIPVPEKWRIDRIDSCLQGAIITADSILTFSRNGSATIGTITLAFTGSAAGDIDSLASPANNTFTAGTYLKITTDGGSANTVNAIITITWSILPP